MRKTFLRIISALICAFMLASFAPFAGAEATTASPMKLEYTLDALYYGGTTSGYWFTDLTTPNEGFNIPSYSNSYGMLEYFGSTKATYSNWMAGWNGGYATHDLSLTGNEYVAYKIRVPAADTYNVKFEKPETGKGGKFKLYIIPHTDGISAVSDLLPYISDTDTLVIDGIEIGNYSVTEYTGTFTADAPGEYYAVWRRVGSSSSNNANYVRIKKLTLTATTATGVTPIWADIALENGNALDAAKAEKTKVILNKVTLSDATKAETVPEITYRSSDDYIATVAADGTVTAKCEGSADILAYTTLSDGSEYCIGSTSVEVTDTGLCGYNAEYSFTKTDYPDASDASGITYESSGGRIEFDHVYSGATKNHYVWSAGYACHSLTRKAIGDYGYATYKIRVPQAGAYTLTYSYYAMTNSTASAVHILPGDTTDIIPALGTTTPVFSKINYNEDNKVIHKKTTRFVADKAGEYLFVLNLRNDSNSGFARPAYLELSGGENAVSGIVGEIKADKTELTVGDSINVTSSAFDSVSGAAVTATLSTESDVISIEDGVLTAEKAGKATVVATADGYTNKLTLDITVSEKETAETADAFVAFAAYSGINGKTVNVSGIDYNGDVDSKVRGTKITVTAPEVEGYKFRYWVRGSSANGKWVSSDAEYSFTLMTNTMLTAVYDETVETDDKQVEFWNQNGAYIATKVVTDGAVEKPSATLTGFTFENWYVGDDEILDVSKLAKAITRAVARYTANKVSGSVTVGGEAVNDIEYNKEITSSVAGATVWYRDGKAVAYGEKYTYYVWDATEITYSTEEVTEKTPLIIIESGNGGAYMIEYDSGDKEIVEAGIVFGNGATIESCEGKATSQKNLSHGQFTATSAFDSARGYIIYKDGDEYIVKYSD